MVGTQIANYRIEEKLGEGGMGVVYKAVDVHLDRVVALKVLTTDLSRDPALLERFRTEAKVQAQLNHTNIASLYTLLVADGLTSIIMEYVEGETFDQMLQRRGLIPSEEAIPLFRQALLGIGCAHRMGIVHRDIKPSNIIVNRQGLVKVMDFGIAKALGRERLTRTGTQLGTVAYMSPEQIRNGLVDIRSDIYSLGATLYELLTAHVPFEGGSEFQVMADHVNTPPIPPTRYYPYIPHGIEQCILKALEKDPAARFQTVEEFGSALEHPQALEEWLERSGAPVPKTSTNGAKPAEPVNVVNAPARAAGVPPRKSNMPLWAGAAVLLLALSAGGYVLWRPKPIAPSGNASSGGASLSLSNTTTDHRDSKATPGLSRMVDNGNAGSSNSASGLKMTAPEGKDSALSPGLTTSLETRKVQPKATSARRAEPVHSTATESPATPAQPPPQPAAAPIPQPSAAEIDTASEDLMKLRARADAVRSSLSNLRSQQAAGGLGLRQDIAAAASRMDEYLQAADRALENKRLDFARKNMEHADAEIGKLEAFFGR